MWVLGEDLEFSCGFWRRTQDFHVSPQIGGCPWSCRSMAHLRNQEFVCWLGDYGAQTPIESMWSRLIPMNFLLKTFFDQMFLVGRWIRAHKFFKKNYKIKTYKRANLSSELGWVAKGWVGDVGLRLCRAPLVWPNNGAILSLTFMRNDRRWRSLHHDHYKWCVPNAWHVFLTSSQAKCLPGCECVLLHVFPFYYT